jgi:hypothetical protein
VKNLADFMHTLETLGQTQDIMVSFDVVVLFTTVLTQVLTLFSDYYEDNILRLPHVLTYSSLGSQFCEAKLYGFGFTISHDCQLLHRGF